MEPKQFVRCNHCERRGTSQTLAELLPNGFVSVERRHHAHDGINHTVIFGNEFSMLCGNCGNIAFIRTKETVEHATMEMLTVFQAVVGTNGTMIGTSGTN